MPGRGLGARVSKTDDLVSVQERGSERDLRNRLPHFSQPHIRKDILSHSQSPKISYPLSEEAEASMAQIIMKSEWSQNNLLGVGMHSGTLVEVEGWDVSPQNTVRLCLC